jgi:hypothetical protein
MKLVARVTVLFDPPPPLPAYQGGPSRLPGRGRVGFRSANRDVEVWWDAGSGGDADEVPLLQPEGTPGESNGAFRSASRPPTRTSGRLLATARCGEHSHLDSGAQSLYRAVVGHQRNTVPSWMSPTCCSTGSSLPGGAGIPRHYFCTPGSAQMKLAASFVDPEPR